MLLTKEQILAQRLPTERVKVPWLDDAEMIIRAMPSHVMQKCTQLNGEYGEDAYVFVNTVVDENGKRLYSDADAVDLANTVDPSLIRFVWAKAWAVSQISPERQAEIKKNLPKILSDALFGASPSPSDTHTQT
jgi:hypothetical protein